MDLTGRRFGHLVVKGKSATRHAKHEGVVWDCNCDCGGYITVNTARLNANRCTSCGCRQGWLARRLPGSLASFHQLYASYKSGAIKRTLAFELTEWEFLWLTQSCCHYCNAWPYQINGLRGRWKDSKAYVYNGVDRTDPTCGYTLENVVPCCGRCNLGKRSLTKEQFLRWIEEIYVHSCRQHECQNSTST